MQNTPLLSYISVQCSVVLEPSCSVEMLGVGGENQFLSHHLQPPKAQLFQNSCQKLINYQSWTNQYWNFFLSQIWTNTRRNLDKYILQFFDQHLQLPKAQKQQQCAFYQLRAGKCIKCWITDTARNFQIKFRTDTEGFANYVSPKNCNFNFFKTFKKLPDWLDCWCKTEMSDRKGVVSREEWTPVEPVWSSIDASTDHFSNLSRNNGKKLFTETFTHFVHIF